MELAWLSLTGQQGSPKQGEDIWAVKSYQDVRSTLGSGKSVFFRTYDIGEALTSFDSSQTNKMAAQEGEERLLTL